MELFINEELKDELPPLVGPELDNLYRTIKRDGIMDSIKYWWNPETTQNEIVDGHHRYAIAKKLGLTYPTHELFFKSMTAVKMWMNVTQAGRRGYRALDRMVELEKMLRQERGEAQTKVADIVSSVAEQAKVSERSVYRSMAKAKMGYENKQLIGDEFDQSAPEDDYSQEAPEEDYNQAGPTPEQRAEVKVNNPFKKPKSRAKSIVNQQKGALRAYSTLLDKMQRLRLDLLFDNGLYLPDFRKAYATIETKRAEFPAPKPRFGR